VIRGIDHVVLVVLDLDEAMRAHRERGFTVTPGGEHAGGLTHNALIGFADGSYLELLAFHNVDVARGKHSWQPIAARGGGWADFALSTGDINADAAALADLLVRPVESGGRTRPDGAAVNWKLARLRSPLPFLIEDVTPRTTRVPHGDSATHTNGITRIAQVVIGTADVARARSDYERLRQRGAPAIQIVGAERDALLDVRFGD
jgi:hypothetical protein